ncbi:MAG: hypothetical protein Q9164_000152 [Protoblastenia rupestris]
MNQVLNPPAICNQAPAKAAATAHIPLPNPTAYHQPILITRSAIPYLFRPQATAGIEARPFPTTDLHSILFIQLTAQRSSSSNSISCEPQDIHISHHPINFVYMIDMSNINGECHTAMIGHIQPQDIRLQVQQQSSAPAAAMDQSSTNSHHHTVSLGHSKTRNTNTQSRQQPLVPAGAAAPTPSEAGAGTKQPDCIGSSSTKPQISNETRATNGKSRAAGRHTSRQSKPRSGRNGRKQKLAVDQTSHNAGELLQQPRFRTATTFPFEATTVLAPIFDGKGQRVHVTMSATMKIGGQWYFEGDRRVIFRRNYIAITDCSYTLEGRSATEDPTLYLEKTSHGVKHGIFSLALEISGRAMDDGDDASLEQFPTAKRVNPHAPQAKTLRPRFFCRDDDISVVDEACQFPESTGATSGIDADVHTWPRVQFAHGTRNNGVRRRNQGCYRLVLSLLAKWSKMGEDWEYCTRIAECATPELIVFARSPQGIKSGRPDDTVVRRAKKVQKRNSGADQGKGLKLAPKTEEDDDSDNLSEVSTAALAAKAEIPDCFAPRRSGRTRHVAGRFNENEMAPAREPRTARACGMKAEDSLSVEEVDYLTAQRMLESGHESNVPTTAMPDASGHNDSSPGSSAFSNNPANLDPDLKDVEAGPWDTEARPEYNGEDNSISEQASSNDSSDHEIDVEEEDYQVAPVNPDVWQPRDDQAGAADSGSRQSYNDLDNPAHFDFSQFQDAPVDLHQTGGWQDEDFDIWARNVLENLANPDMFAEPDDILSAIGPLATAADMDQPFAPHAAETSTTVYDNVYHDDAAPSFSGPTSEALPTDDSSWPSEFEDWMSMYGQGTAMSSLDNDSVPSLIYERNFMGFNHDI